MARARNKDVAIAENKLVLMWMKGSGKRPFSLCTILECVTILTHFQPIQATGGLHNVWGPLQDSTGRVGDAEREAGDPLPKVPPRTRRAGGLLVTIGLSAFKFKPKWWPFFLQVKHAKAHAQMLRQTISAIKTEVWDPSLELKGSWDLSFGLYWLCIYKADQDFAGWRIFQVIRWSAIWLLTVCEELLWCTTMYQWAFPSPIWW